MKYAFTDRTRKVLAGAREAAFGWGHDYVGTEHLLAALLRDGEGVSASVLARLRVDPGEIRGRLEDAVRGGGRPVPMGELPYTSRAKKVLELAMREARRLSHPYVGTEHLLLGLIAEEKGIAAQVLRQFGVTLERAREATAAVLDASARHEGSGTGREDVPARFRIRIDDTSSSSIYEQIVAQVREAVATGALGPGERLPSVRSLADELDIAPGTVARAYGELEQLGLVVTDGARGTRVAEIQPSAPPASERHETLVGLLRPVAVAAFHLGATAAELRGALGPAMEGIFGEEKGAA